MGQDEGARRLGVSALFSHAAVSAHAGVKGARPGGCWSPRYRVYAPWVVSPACGIDNEAFLRSNSITSFGSQEPAAAAAATATAT